MSKKYFLIGILVITVALLISAFTWVSISRSTGSQAALGQDLTSLSEADKLADRYAAMAKFYEPLYASKKASPGLVVVGKYVDDHYSIKSVPSAELSVTERLAAIQAGSYSGLASQYQEHIYPSLSGSYLVVVSAFHDR